MNLNTFVGEKQQKKNIEVIKMRLNNLLYLTDDYIYLKNRKLTQVIKYKINKNIILYGKIFNIDKFLKTFNNLLNEHHLNNNLFGDTLKIIINPTYTPADITLLKMTMEKFNYRKIIFENETKRYKLNTQNAYLNIFDNYQILTVIDEYKKIQSYLITTNFFNDNLALLKYIKSKIAKKDLYLIGNSAKLTEIFSEFETKHQNKTYMYTDHELFLLNSVHSL